MFGANRRAGRAGPGRWCARTVSTRQFLPRVWVATRICPLTATGDCLHLANSPRFVVAFCAGKEPFGQHDFAGYFSPTGSLVASKVGR